jgi:hypothetical protein
MILVRGDAVMLVRGLAVVLPRCDEVPLLPVELLLGRAGDAVSAFSSSSSEVNPAASTGFSIGTNSDRTWEIQAPGLSELPFAASSRN